jgi:UDP-2,3-diacylglucosamine pyrophosphatase LpxH
MNAITPIPLDADQLHASRPFHPEAAVGERRRFRTIWISDIHLGTRGCNARLLIDFLDHVDSETMYLVGDIIDGWRMRKRFYWPPSHNDVIWRILKRAKRGTRIVYIPGNHDEFLRDYYGSHFGGVEVAGEIVHTAADGRRYLVTHGDLFDIVIRHARWLAYVGDKAYELAIFANTAFNRLRRALDLPYWSLSKWAKLKVKNAVNFISDFEDVLIREAQRHGVDGVICGHIHHAALRREGRLTYINCGDWVESCTAIGEHPDGSFEILTWSEALAGVAGAAATVDARAA